MLTQDFEPVEVTVKTCVNCSTPLKRGQFKFCSRSCSVTVANKAASKRKKTKKAKPCPNCGTLTENPRFCSNPCQTGYKYKLVGEEVARTGVFPSEAVARRYLIHVHGLKCWECGIDSWRGKDLPVVLDHINGHAEDNSLKNLRLLCCNCDAQTDTYKGRNVGKGRHSRLQRYHDGKSY